MIIREIVRHISEIDGEIITYIILVKYYCGIFTNCIDNSLTFLSDSISIFTVDLRLNCNEKHIIYL